MGSEQERQVPTTQPGRPAVAQSGRFLGEVFAIRRSMNIVPDDHHLMEGLAQARLVFADVPLGDSESVAGIALARLRFRAGPAPVRFAGLNVHARVGQVPGAAQDRPQAKHPPDHRVGRNLQSQT